MSTRRREASRQTKPVRLRLPVPAAIIYHRAVKEDDAAKRVFESQVRLGVLGEMYEVGTGLVTGFNMVHVFTVGDLWRGQDFHSFCGRVSYKDSIQGWPDEGKLCDGCWETVKKCGLFTAEVLPR